MTILFFISHLPIENGLKSSGYFTVNANTLLRLICDWFLYVSDFSVRFENPRFIISSEIPDMDARSETVYIWTI